MALLVPACVIVTAVILATFLPFAPAGHDPLAVPLSAMAWVLGRVDRTVSGAAWCVSRIALLDMGRLQTVDRGRRALSVRAERRGEAYNVIFKEPALAFGTGRFVVYNPLDRQRVTVHEQDRLRLDDAGLDADNAGHTVVQPLAAALEGLSLPELTAAWPSTT